MARVILIAIAVSFLASYGMIGAATLLKGPRAGRFVAGVLLSALAAAGITAWGVYWATKRGALSPDDFYNGVVGNAVVVGGLLASAGAALGVLAAFLTFLRQRP